MLWTQQLITLTGVFSAKRRRLETSGFQKVLYTSSGENLVFTGTLVPEDTCWKHRQMCGFSWKALPEEAIERRKQQSINSELGTCGCFHACAYVCELIRMPSLFPRAGGRSDVQHQCLSGWKSALRIPCRRCRKVLPITWNASGIF